MKNFKQKLLIIWFAVITVSTLTPMPVSTISAPAYSDKIAHIILFGFFSFLVFLNLAAKYKERQTFLISVISSLIFSGLIEIIQTRIPGRTASWLDIMAGVFGALVFTMAAIILNKKKC
jgi:VanZ family protein